MSDATRRALMSGCGCHVTIQLNQAGTVNLDTVDIFLSYQPAVSHWWSRLSHADHDSSITAASEIRSFRGGKPQIVKRSVGGGQRANTGTQTRHNTLSQS